jgi:hypothetical protein
MIVRWTKTATRALLWAGIFAFPLALQAVPDGDLAPRGTPDGQVNAADLLIMQRIVLNLITPTTPDFERGDLYPPGAPDGLLNLSDMLILLQIIQQTSVPVAVDDAASTVEDTMMDTSNVLTNDTLVDNAVISHFDAISANSADENVLYIGGGIFGYSPPPGFIGIDSFTYTLTDIQNESDTATVTITVNPVNDLPVAVNDAVSLDEDTVLNGNVLLDNGALGDEPTSVNPGAVNVTDGSLTLNTDGTFSYTPNPGFNGTDSFSYSLTDSTPETSTEATVTITVNGQCRPGQGHCPATEHGRPGRYRQRRRLADR